MITFLFNYNDPMSPDALTPDQRKRMGLQRKLWIAGIGFPTLLLLVIAVYFAQRAPTIRLIGKLEEITTAQLTTEGITGTDALECYPVSAELPFSWVLDGKTRFGSTDSWVYRYFGTIRHITLDGVRVEAKVFEQIGSIDSLESLTLIVVRFDPVAILEPLSELKSLKRLLIHPSSKPLDDSSLQWISQIDGLESLDLMEASGVTDEGLTQLHRLKQLKRVRISGCNASAGAVERLKAALPDATIEIFPPTRHDGEPYGWQRERYGNE